MAPGPRSTARAQRAHRVCTIMVVGVSTFELHLPACRSLKGKRKVVKSLVDRIHARFRVSIAETDFHDLHQRAEISLALVSRSEHEANRMMDEIRNLIDGIESDAFLTVWDPQILEPMG